MKVTSISSCYISPDISIEQYIPEHFFLYLVKGTMSAYDGNKEYKVVPGDSGIGRRNHLAKYSKRPDNGIFEKVAIIFDQPFLKSFHEQYKFSVQQSVLKDSLIKLKKNKLIDNFVQSLIPYYNDKGIIDPQFHDIKRTELLFILLKQDPMLGNIFFDFGDPGKINLEEFMMKNYKFNVSIERFAYLTGRSLSAFKRDFQKIFNATPAHWLVQKRLEEAYFLIEKKNKNPSDIYLDLGFEDLSHFSFAFKKLFGVAPTQIGK